MKKRGRNIDGEKRRGRNIVEREGDENTEEREINTSLESWFCFTFANKNKDKKFP